MIRATFRPSLVAADTVGEARTVAGVAVPWDTEGTVSDGTRVVFHPGSIDATHRPVLLRDHDAARPLGRVIDAADTGTGLTATARVARTRDGDDALVLAAPPDLVLGMFSVGADPTDFTYDQAGVMHVYAADWRELSLLTMGAYNAARVATVTAQHPAAQPEEPAMNDQLVAELDPDEVDPDEADDTAADEDTVAIDAPVAPVNAAAGRRAPAAPLRAAGAARRPAPLDLRGVATILAGGAKRGWTASQASARIRAAFTNVLTVDVPGAVPPYRAELVPTISYGMPLVDAITTRPLPPYGMRVEYPIWTDPPDSYAIQAGEKQAIASGMVRMDTGFADVKTWAQGNDISFQTANRSDPSFIELYLQECGKNAAKVYDQYVGNQLLAAATAATAGTDFVSNVAALYAALDPTTTPAGSLFLAVSYDVHTSLIGVTGDVGPAYWDLSIGLGSMIPGVNGGIVVDPWLPAGTMLLGSKAGAVSYGGPAESADVRVVDVSLLGIDIGVYFMAALAIPYPDAFAKLTGIVTATGTARTPAKSTK